MARATQRPADIGLEMDYVDLRQFQANARQQIAAGNLEQPLVDIVRLVFAVVDRRTAEAKVFSSPELDAICEEIGLATLQYRPPASIMQEAAGPPVTNLFVATELYSSGGHSRVIEDFVALSEGQTCAVVVTNSNNQPEDRIYVQRLLEMGVKILLCPTSLSPIEKVFWLERQYSQLSPKRIYHFIHQWDAIAVAAAVVIPKSVGYYFHHCDHNLALGVHTPGLTHIDAHTAGFAICRHALNVRGNKYWPLCAIDHGIRSESSFYVRGALTTASSGLPIKFLPPTPYPINYFRLIPSLIRKTLGFHVHFGQIPPTILEDLHKDLVLHGVPLEKFIHVPWVPSLWKAMSEYGVDVYLNSFPLGGGKSCVEIMGSGTPTIAHRGHYPTLLSGIFLQYQEAMQWQSEADLFSALELCRRRDLLLEHRLWARRQYDRNHRPERLAALIRDPELMLSGSEGLARTPLIPMSLQDFLFMESYEASE